jgi:hypothetical protein
MTEAKHTTLNLPSDLKQKARAKAIERGSNLSAVVIAFLRAWLEGEIELPQPKPSRKGGKHKTR